MQLNDTHLVLLSAAAQRDDKLLVLPGTLGQRAADKLASRLEAAGLVEVVAVTAHQPQWASGPEGEPSGLRITEAGLDAIGIERDSSAGLATLGAGDEAVEAAAAAPEAEQVERAVEHQPSGSAEQAAVDERSKEAAPEDEASPSEISSQEALGEEMSSDAACSDVSSDAVASAVVLPRAGSKRALLVAMLQREEGASVEAIMAVMGWLPHSTRAALTGLRKAGYQLVRSKEQQARLSTA